MLQELRRLVPKHPAKLLDVGCGHGFFLQLAKTSGFAVKGVDISRDCVSYAQQIYGLDVFCGQIQEADIPSASFDVVTCYEVLEHVLSPKGLLTEIRRVLCLGGLLCIAVPNVESYAARHNPNWWHEYHLFHFSRQTLPRYLEETGFETRFLIANPHVPLSASSPARRASLWGQTWVITLVRRLLATPLRALSAPWPAGAITVYAIKRST